MLHHCPVNADGCLKHPRVPGVLGAVPHCLPDIVEGHQDLFLLDQAEGLAEAAPALLDVGEDLLVELPDEPFLELLPGLVKHVAAVYGFPDGPPELLQVSAEGVLGLALLFLHQALLKLLPDDVRHVHLLRVELVKHLVDVSPENDPLLIEVLL